MKKIIYLIFISLLAFTSCKKDGGSPTETNTNPNTVTDPPLAPTLVVPADSGTGISIQCTFSWYPSKGAEKYNLEIATDSFFTNKIIERTGLKVSSLLISGFAFSTKYYWRVNATNNAGTSSYSPIRNFSTADSLLQFTSISGKVTNSLNEPIQGAKIYTVPTTSTVYSDSTGYYLLKNISGGSYSLFSEKEGYNKYIANIFAAEGLAVGQNITMIVLGAITPCPGTPTVSYEGKTYNTVQIGSQCWMKENLNVGTMITGSSSQTNNGITEKYCYENKTVNCDNFGALYEWNEAMQYSESPGSKGICPTGWHIPTKEELKLLSALAGNSSTALREVGQGTGTNISGFSAMLAGYRYDVSHFYNYGEHAAFWSSTEYIATDAFYLGLRRGYSVVDLGAASEVMGFSVRCIKD